MHDFFELLRPWRQVSVRLGPGRCFSLLCAAAFLLPPTARAQVSPAGEQGGLILSAGATGSAVNVQYGQHKMLGITGFVDADTRRRIGVELEGHWMEFHQNATGVHIETYSAGLRYHFYIGRRFQPYVKGLAGFGDFNFPYNSGTGRYLVITAGGGLDYHLSHRFTLRAADLEYQDWPQFTFGNMSTPTVSTGIRVRVF